MKALSVRQPWAWAIIHAAKNVENRTRRCHHRGPLLIHASKRKTTKAELLSFSDFCLSRFGRETGAALVVKACREAIGVRGGIIGQVEVVDCVSEEDWIRNDTYFDSPWFTGPYGIVLAKPKPLPFREFKGTLGLFDADYKEK